MATDRKPVPAGGHRGRNPITRDIARLEIAVLDRGGTEHKVEAEAGLSVMEAIRDGGIEELVAMCGGCCSCATCHVYVEHVDGELSPLGDDENELLDASSHRQANSRLSCQLALSPAIRELRLRIAPED